MMRTIGGKLRGIWQRISHWPGGRRQSREKLPALRGNMGRVIMVTPPDPMFSQAMFILRDDYFQGQGLSRQELLNQAKLAAEDYVEAELKSPNKPLFPSAAALFSMGAASAILALWIGGVI